VVKHPEELALIREAARYADMVLTRSSPSAAT
jgi:Xaa-Pro aminopeptidase